MKSKVAVLVIILLSLGATAMLADDAPPAGEVQPGVGRISSIHGDVSTQRGDSGDWVAGTVNAPVVAGDSVSTGLRSRAELQLDYANILRLSERTEAKLADLTRTHNQIQVSHGLVSYSVLKGSEADVEIDTPNVAVRPIGEGNYRVLVFADDETQVVVREGEADITTPQGSTRVKRGESITIRGTDNPEYQTAGAPPTDDFDRWSRDRDHQILNAQSWGRTNRYYTGASDLDPYGRWVYVPGYDWVWSPVVASGWAPYRDGRWVWEPYWGWTWVSYEPWGWAPYHYGRWFLHAGSWCWWPGPVYGGYRPLWAPAYVSFFGFGRHFGVNVGFGFGSFGWLPIGPSDPFFPWWGRRGRSINVVNVTNIINVRNWRERGGWEPLGGGRPFRSNLDGMLNDRRLQSGLTSMPANEFGQRSVSRNFRRVDFNELRQGQVVNGTLPVVPTRESLRTSDRAVSNDTLTTRPDRSTRFFTRSQPTTAPRSFQNEAAQVRETVQQHEQAMAERPGRPMRDGGGMQAGAPAESSRAMNQDARATRSEQQGWHRFGNLGTLGSPSPNGERTAMDPQATPQRAQRQVQSRDQAQTRTQAQPSNPGWQRFERQSGSQGAPQRAPRNGGRWSSPAAAPSATPERSNPSMNRPERPGFQRFTPQPEARPMPREAPSMDRSYSPQPQAPERSWNRPSPNYGESQRMSRPPLDFRRPIVTPRASSPRESGSRPQSEPRGGQGGGSGNRSSSRGPHGRR